MLRLLGNRPGPIGIDLSGRTVKAVQVAGSGASRRVVASAMIPRRIDTGLEAEAGRLAGVFERQGFSGRSVALCVPDAALLTSVLELPPRSSGAPVDRIARGEMATLHRRQPEAIEVACWDVPSSARSAERTHAMAVACAHVDAEPLVQAFGAAGYEVVVLDARCMAIARACESLWAAPPALSVVLDIGWDSSLLVVVADRVVVYERTLEACDLKRVHAALVSREGLGANLADQVLRGETGDSLKDAPGDTARAVEHHAQAIGDQLELSMSYVAHRYPELSVGVVLLAGEGAELPGLPACISARIGAPATVIRAADLVPGAPARAGAACIGALGLAIGAMEGRS